MSDERALAIEGKIDRNQTGALMISGKTSAVTFERLGDMMDFAKLMAISDVAVPKYLRTNVGACLAIVVQANEWNLSPFSVARMSFNVGDTIGYFAMLLHAVVERRAPIKERLRFEYTGEGQDRQVIVTGHFKGEVDPVSYTSPKVKDIRPKNSPLWISDTDQQLSYMGSRAWARRYCPDVLLGVYSADEIDDTRHVGAENAKDVTPEEQGLHHRLSAKAAAGAGFDAAGISTTLSEASRKPEPEQNSSAAIRTAAGAQAAVSDPTSPAGAETSAEGSPVGDTAGNGGPASETAAASSPSYAAAVEAPKRRGRPPKAAAEQTQDSSEVSPSVVAEPETHNEPPQENTLAEIAPPPLAPETAAGQDPAAVEADAGDTVIWEDPPAEIDDELPSDELPVDRVPDPPIPALPEEPKDGGYYCGYVRVMLRQPEMQTEEAVRKWWGSFEQKRLRNGLVNYTAEISQKAIGIITEHIKALKGA